MRTVYNHAMSRERRHQIIAQLLEAQEVQSQDVLRTLLAEQGVETTQATVSRDLREMGVIKGPAGYTIINQWNAANALSLTESGLRSPLERVLESSILSAQPAGTLIVLKTAPGHAQVVAVEFDRHPPEGVAGTVAGDDTIFVACLNQAAAAELLDTVRYAAGLASSPSVPSTNGSHL